MADYAPFYFAPRSPMMYAIEKRNVPTYSSGCDHIVYLVTTVEQLVEMGLAVVFTDRNAVLAVASFTADIDRLDSLVDWSLMMAKWWYNTPEEPDRREREWRSAWSTSASHGLRFTRSSWRTRPASTKPGKHWRA